MKILKLKLRGAIGIKKGLGIEEIEIDFTKFQSGLIALTGKNGSGKTTIMENLHPYRCMVSRDGSLQSHFFLKDSHRILDFEFNSKLYQSRILIDALTGASEAYLFYNSNGFETALNDGKLTTYDIEIEKLLGTPELFFNSVFSGQKSKGIAELKPAERRKLFYELLNLDSYEKYLELAKSELKNQEIKLAEIEGEIKSLQTDYGQLDGLEVKKILVETDIDISGISIATAKDEIEKIQESIQKTEVEIRANTDKLADNAAIEVELKKLTEEKAELIKQHSSKVSRYNSDIEDSKKLIERNQKLLNNKSTIDSKITLKNQISEEIASLSKVKSEIQADLNKHQTEYTEVLKQISVDEENLNQKAIHVNNLRKEVEGKEKEITRLDNETMIIGDVPCSPEIGTSCLFLLNAYKSKNELPELKNLLNELKAKFDQTNEAFNSLSDDIQSRKQLAEENYTINTSWGNEKVKLFQTDLDKLELNLKELNKTDWGNLSNEVKKAENEINLLNQKTDSTNELIKQEEQHYSNSINKLTERETELNAKLDNNINDRIHTLRNELNSLRGNRDIKKDELSEIESTLADQQKQLATIEEQINQVKKNKERLIVLGNEKSKVESEIKDWTFLTKAFDKTGIPVLKLENSGIEITSIANELLSIFENKFRIVFETTSLTKDKKKMKETFDINIVEDDGVCEISNKSGGQQVYLETAIRLAISIVIKKQGKNIETAFLDEADGALDLDNAFHYIEMIQRSHQMSGVYNTFIITHRPELLDFIPQQVKLTDGYLQILN